MRIWLLFFIVTYATAATEGDDCTMPDGTQGECQRIHSCPTQLAELRQKGLKAHGFLTALTKHCRLEPHIARNPGVCCAKTIERTICKFLEPTCGLVDSSKLLGGIETSVGEFPWMALLGYKIDEEIKFLCGGALIHPRWVLTAAHCINDKIRTVRLGEHDLSSSPDCVQLGIESYCPPEPVDAKILRTIINPNYLKRSLTNDIALVELETSVQFTEEINSICLPSGNAAQMNLENQNMTVAGWGRTEDPAGNGSEVLKKLEVPVIAQSRCSADFNRLASLITITAEQICTGGEPNQDACKGDSGGPLMKQISLFGRMRWTLFGLGSFGPSNCSTKGVPSVYTRITEYLQWIMTTVQP